MNKTKKYTIIFVVASFLGILIVSYFNTKKAVPIIEDNQDQEVIEENENDQEIEVLPEQDQQPELPIQEDTSKKDSVIPSKKDESKPQEDSKQDSNQIETLPEEPEDIKPVFKVSISITGMDGLMAQGNIEFEGNKSVFDILKTLCDQNSLSISTTGFGQIIYVKGINGLNEFDYGPESGWKYKVNGVYPSAGAGAYKIKDGDQIEWVYETVK